MFLDIHSHNSYSDANLKKLFNLDISTDALSMDLEEFFGENKSVSVGIHPWSVSEEAFGEQLEMLEYLGQDARVKAIGEIGLDKIKGPDLQLQEEVFLRQIRIAENLRKPMVIHCVRSFNELIAIKKLVQPKVPMIIHGFNRKPELANELAGKGFFLSFGKAMLDSESVKQALIQTPIDQVFFETDDAEALNISEVYECASRILEIEMEELKDKIYQNYLELYI